MKPSFAVAKMFRWAVCESSRAGARLNFSLAAAWALARDASAVRRRNSSSVGAWNPFALPYCQHASAVSSRRRQSNPKVPIQGMSNRKVLPNWALAWPRRRRSEKSETLMTKSETNPKHEGSKNSRFLFGFPAPFVIRIFTSYH